MIYLKKLLLIFIVLGLKLTITAQVKLPALVGDNMVLQQSSKVNLWGWASPNEKIKIQLGWQNNPVDITANADGTWKTAVATPAGSEKQYDITIEASNKIILKNILIGEVWICSGQSNMYFPVGKEEGTWKTGVKNYEGEIQNANFPSIRLFTVQTKASQKPLEDVIGNWNQCSPSIIKYFFCCCLFLWKGFISKFKSSYRFNFNFLGWNKSRSLDFTNGS